MTELTLQISVRLQEEDVPQDLARKAAQLFECPNHNMYDAMEAAMGLLLDHYAAQSRTPAPAAR